MLSEKNRQPLLQPFPASPPLDASKRSVIIKNDYRRKRVHTDGDDLLAFNRLKVHRFDAVHEETTKLQSQTGPGEDLNRLMNSLDIPFIEIYAIAFHGKTHFHPVVNATFDQHANFIVMSQPNLQSTSSEIAPDTLLIQSITSAIEAVAFNTTSQNIRLLSKDRDSSLYLFEESSQPEYSANAFYETHQDSSDVSYRESSEAEGNESSYNESDLTDENDDIDTTYLKSPSDKVPFGKDTFHHIPLYIMKSSLPGSGRGLFTVNAIREGEVIGRVNGKIESYRSNKPLRSAVHTHSIFISSPHNKKLVAITPHKNNAFRYLNKAYNQEQPALSPLSNVTFHTPTRLRKSHLVTFVKAIRDIPARGELLFSYDTLFDPPKCEQTSQPPQPSLKKSKRKHIRRLSTSSSDDSDRGSILFPPTSLTGKKT